MENKILFSFFIFIHSILILLYNDLIPLGEYYFYFLFSVLIINFLITKKLTLFQVWCFSFLFVILSEVFTTPLNKYHEIIRALKFLLLSNNAVILGYVLCDTKTFKTKPSHFKILKERRFSNLVILLTIVGYLAFIIPLAILAFTLGRIERFEQSTGFIEQIIQSVALVFPAIVTYFFLNIKHKKLIIPLILSLPIFVSLFMLGSRYPLLFSVGGVFLVYYNYKKGKLSFKLTILFITITSVLMFASSLIKSERGSNDSSLRENKVSSIPVLFSTFSSPEGVVYNTSQMMKYFDNNDFLYGESSSYILYFWVPRSLWPDKPTQLGHWLVRKYDNVSQFHSVSYGFTGELYSDFGYYSLFFMIIIGFLLRKGESFKHRLMKSGGYNVIMVAMLFPYIFFFVRSPITGSTIMIGILFFFFIYKLVLIKKKHL